MDGGYPEPDPRERGGSELKKFLLNCILFQVSVGLLIDVANGGPWMLFIVIVCTQVVLVNDFENDLASVATEILFFNGKLTVVTCLPAMVAFYVFLYHLGAVI